MSAPASSFAFWLDQPFVPRRPARRGRPRARAVTIRYQGSIARSAFKALIVMALMAFLSGLIGERKSPSLDATVAAARAESAVPRR